MSSERGFGFVVLAVVVGCVCGIPFAVWDDDETMLLAIKTQAYHVQQQQTPSTSPSPSYQLALVADCLANDTFKINQCMKGRPNPTTGDISDTICDPDGCVWVSRCDCHVNMTSLKIVCGPIRGGMGVNSVNSVNGGMCVPAAGALDVASCHYYNQNVWWRKFNYTGTVTINNLGECPSELLLEPGAAEAATKMSTLKIILIVVGSVLFVGGVVTAGAFWT
eukprot:c9444_g1_i1.p1 GENE.c9444_g1_i1~~c9444_g1_i1.p1  ORF type:complete len:221 (+),score=58.50 c9444_g1_i1:64-726(+)